MSKEFTYRHHKHELVRAALKCGNVALIGPAGSGKTTMAQILAEELGLEFHFTGAVMSEYKLTGFIDAKGEVVRTPFREAFENGGLFLFDEVDGSAPAALLALNAALSNGRMDFPDKCVQQHPDFRVIAASNTFWSGGDRVYVGRNQLDGATLDRFIMIDLDYDETLERNLTSNTKWVDWVQMIRGAAKQLEIRHIVSPRASMVGENLLANGVDWDNASNMAIWKGLDEESKQKILLHLKEERREQEEYQNAMEELKKAAEENQQGQNSEENQLEGVPDFQRILVEMGYPQDGDGEGGGEGDGEGDGEGQDGEGGQSGQGGKVEAGDGTPEGENNTDDPEHDGVGEEDDYDPFTRGKRK